MMIEKRAVCTLLVVVLILVLFYLCFGVLFPNAGIVPYSDEAADGTRVTHEGIILSSKITATGGHTILNVSGVTVFVEGGAGNIFYQAGDRVQVIGIVDTYSGVREIAVRTGGSIQLLEN